MDNTFGTPKESHPFNNAQFNPSSGSSAPLKSYFEPQRTVSGASATSQLPSKTAPVTSSKTTPSVQVFSQGDKNKAQFSTPKKKSRKKVLIGMLIAFLILAGGLGGFSIYYFNQPTKAAVNPDVTPSNQTSVASTILKTGNLVKFGDEKTTFKVSGKIWLDNLSHPEDATKVYVYLESATGEGSTTAKSLKAGDKVSFGTETTVYIIDKFAFNQTTVSKATLCTITIHEVSKSAATTSQSTSGTTSETIAE